MKTKDIVNIVLLFITFLLYFSINAISANVLPTATDTSVCLEVKANVFVRDYDASESYRVQLLCLSASGDTNLIASANKLDFFLMRNKIYFVRISQPGFESRVISINTELPEEIHPAKIFNMGFEINLPELHTIEKEWNIEDDKSLTSIYYNKLKGRFDYVTADIKSTYMYAAGNTKN